MNAVYIFAAGDAGEVDLSIVSGRLRSTIKMKFYKSNRVLNCNLKIKFLFFIPKARPFF